MQDTIETPAIPDDIAKHIVRGDAEACLAWLDTTASADAVHELTRLDDAERHQLLTLLPADEAADVIDRLPHPQAVDAIGKIAPDAAARIVDQLASADQADLLTELDDADAEAILEHLPCETAADLRRLTAYEPDIAGGIMITEFLSYPVDSTVGDAVRDIEANAEKYRHFDIQYTYAVDAAGRLLGVVPMRNLLLAPKSHPLLESMIADPISLPDQTPLDDLKKIFDEYPFVGLPVVDPDGRLVGVVRRAGLEEARAEESESQFRLSQGIVGGEELRQMPLLLRSRRRLAWLSVNILLNIAAASVIALHQDTLEAVIALAVFLPIISDMSGCSGNQAVAVSIRELTLGVIRPRDLISVILAEVKVGLINGIALGFLIGLVAFVWKGNVYLGLVVAVALLLNTIVAVIIGGSVPLILKSLKRDPALASGPILTTVTDMCGFFLVLSIAGALLSKLT
jgi:magnesium transporter